MKKLLLICTVAMASMLFSGCVMSDMSVAGKERRAAIKEAEKARKEAEKDRRAAERERQKAAAQHKKEAAARQKEAQKEARKNAGKPDAVTGASPRR